MVIDLDAQVDAALAKFATLDAKSKAAVRAAFAEMDAKKDADRAQKQRETDRSLVQTRLPTAQAIAAAINSAQSLVNSLASTDAEIARFAKPSTAALLATSLSKKLLELDTASFIN